MRSWPILPALALSALGALALSGDGAVRLEGKSHLVRLAALQTTDTLSDACVWTPEAAAAGEPGPCGTAAPVLGTLSAEAVEAPAPEQTAHRPLVWPDDFIAMTIAAATEAWSTTVGWLTDLYDYAFEGDKVAEKPTGT